MASLIQRFRANEVGMASVMLHEEEGDLESKMALTAAVMADKSRSRMLCALMDGCARLQLSSARWRIYPRRPPARIWRVCANNVLLSRWRRADIVIFALQVPISLNCWNA